jgi:Right handed beta helix region
MRNAGRALLIFLVVSAMEIACYGQAQPGGDQSRLAASNARENNLSSLSRSVVCEGIDDTARIQAAIDAASAAGGGEVSLVTKAATCVADGLMLRSNVSLRGAHHRLLTLKHKDHAKHPLISLASKSESRWGIYELGIDGNKAAQTAPQDEIRIDGADYGLTHRATISDVSVVNSSGNGIVLAESKGGGGDIDLFNVNVNGSAGVGIYIGIDDVDCVRCEASQNGSFGFQIEKAGNVHVVESKSWMNAGDGFHVHLAWGGTYIGLEAQSNQGAGMSVDSCQDVLASSLHIEDSGRGGLVLNNVQFSRFDGLVYKSHQYGIVFGSSVTNNSVDVASHENAAGDYSGQIAPTVAVTLNGRMNAARLPAPGTRP